MKTVQILKDRFYENTEHGPIMVPTGTYPVEYDGETMTLILFGYPSHPACLEGHPDQRFRFQLED